MSPLVNYFRSNFKHLLLAIALTLVVSLTFIAYMVLIGIPKTQARNLYNQAQAKFAEGDEEEGEKLLEEAYIAWPEGYIWEIAKDE